MYYSQSARVGFFILGVLKAGGKGKKGSSRKGSWDDATYKS